MRSLLRPLFLLVLLAASLVDCATAFFVPSRSGGALLLRVSRSSTRSTSSTAEKLGTSSVISTLRNNNNSGTGTCRPRYQHHVVSMALPALPAAITSAMTSCGSVVETVKAAMLSGSHILPTAGLTAVSAATVVPLTLFRQAYSFSVGYGCAVAAMCASLIRTFGLPSPFTKSAWTGLTTGAVPAPTLLTYAGLFYGLRLSAFLLLREVAVPSKSEQIKKLDKTSKPARIPFASAVGMFYAFMVSPVLFALRAASNGAGLSCPLGICAPALLAKVQWAGVILAFVGLTTEAVADQHKFFVKRNYGYTSSFVGPTRGLYGLCRHPNYLGEILFWTGIYLGGLPAFGTNVAAWITSTLGLWGIVSIMTGATKRLDEKQADRYEGEGAYKSWRDDVKAPLFPFVE
mmetsp:Transcript_34622/g.75103  ORF Transcript_34622/g.75103 Transcript_34622/m.75103 type:complete len:402 (+) Transcript_34622:50-1255(+)